MISVSGGTIMALLALVVVTIILGSMILATSSTKESNDAEAVDDWTMRDDFAAEAMSGMMARDAYDEGQATPEQRARLAYMEADAMMEARKQQP